VRQRQLALNLGDSGGIQVAQPEPLPHTTATKNLTLDPRWCGLQQADGLDQIAFTDCVRTDQHIQRTEFYRAVVEGQDLFQ
jgi:hypothetical protein